MQAHTRNCVDCQNIKIKASLITWTCEFCGITKTTRLSTMNLHKNHCELNPDRLPYKGHKVSEETRQKISKTCKSNKLSGGYRHGSGRGRKGTYKGYYCDSSWELAYVIYNLEHNISFRRNEELFPYMFKGEQHNYKPDFIEGDVYVEIKGYFSEQVNAKEKAFPFKLKYIDKNSIKPYIEYAVDKYGKDFCNLYEGQSSVIRKRSKKPHNVPYTCPHCSKTYVNRRHIKNCLRLQKEEKEKEEKHNREVQSKKELIDKGYVDSTGRLNKNVLQQSVWEERKQAILQSNVDLTKFGWISKVMKSTGLTKRIIYDTVVHFNLDVYKLDRARY